MSSLSVTKAAKAAIVEIRQALGPLGLVEGANGAFRAGHMPEKGPFWYSAKVFGGLSETEIDRLESQLPYPVPEQTKAIIPAPMREFLAVTNGLHCHNLSIDGQIGRIDKGAGAPFSLYTPQLERPPGVPKLWFGVGGINGTWAAQGTLYLTEADEVVIVHRDTGDIGARWAGLAEFLSTEIPRLLSVHDSKGDVLPGESALPGDTQGWEEKAERAKRRAAGWRGYLRRLVLWLGRVASK